MKLCIQEVSCIVKLLETKEKFYQVKNKHVKHIYSILEFTSGYQDASLKLRIFLTTVLLHMPFIDIRKFQM